MEPSDLFGGLGKFEEEAESVKDPEGRVIELNKQRRASQVQGGLIKEQSGKCAADYECGCPASEAADGGSCVVGKGRTCRSHRSFCSVCGLPSCQRHRVIVNGMPVCHNCYTVSSDPTWIVLLAIALLGVVLLLRLRFGS